MSATEATENPPEPGTHQNTMPETKGGKGPLDPDSPHIFKHAPKFTTSDAWEILLKPELEADTERCSAWKDEVQNVLIFAGLFSAVVTTFLIQSYQFLQPDPNDAVIGLLFHIANGLNNSSPFPPSVNPAAITTPFSPTSSSIRINVLWLISLILSLTTVLVGTISLQWLREHQSYAGFSTKEKLAIFRMRSEALEVWRVPQIFAALPVLLQGAVALFLVGLIEFALPLGQEITIAVSAAVGATLFFLTATTILPTCQGFLFLTGIYPYSKPPTPCAFKSPQSRVVLAIFSPLIRLLSYIILIIPIILECVFNSSFLLRRYDMFPHLRKVLQQKTWPTLDRKWLNLRDAYHQCILDTDKHLYGHQDEWRDSFPLSDVTQFLVKAIKEIPTAKHTDTFLGAAVFCFQEISASIWIDFPTEVYPWQRKDRRNNYFEHLHLQNSCSMSGYLLHGGAYQYDKDDDENFFQYIGTTTTLNLLHQDQILFFLVVLLRTHKSPALCLYQNELWTEILFKSLKIAPLKAIGNHSSPTTPFILNYSTIKSICTDTYEGHLAGADILSAIFKLAASRRISQERSMTSFHTSFLMVIIPLYQLAYLFHSYLHWLETGASRISNEKNNQEIADQYISVFKFVANHLNQEWSNFTSTSREDTPSVLFYLASAYIQVLLESWRAEKLLQDKDSRFGQELASLLKALLQYRTWTETMTPGRETDVIKTYFQKYRGQNIFSDKWWGDFIRRGRHIGLEAAEQEPALVEGSTHDIHPNAPSQGGNNPENAENGVITPPSPSISPLTISHPLSNYTQVSHTDSQPASSINAASHSDDRDEDKRRHSPPGIPDTSNHTIATSEGLDINDNPPFPTPQPSFPRPDTTRPAGGGQAIGDIARRDSSPTQLPASSGSTSLLSTAHELVAGSDSRPDRHVAIDVGAITITAQVKLEITGSDGDLAQERPMEGDAVISVPPAS